MREPVRKGKSALNTCGARPIAQSHFWHGICNTSTVSSLHQSELHSCVNCCHAVSGVGGANLKWAGASRLKLPLQGTPRPAKHGGTRNDGSDEEKSGHVITS